MWWTCTICCLAVSPILLIIERTRIDRDEQERLDQEAIRAGDALAEQHKAAPAEGGVQS